MDRLDIETMDGESPAPKPANAEMERGQKRSRNYNVGDRERSLSLAAGALLLVTSLGKLRRGQGLVQAAAGAGLIYRGLSGSCPLYNKLGVTTREADNIASDSNRTALQEGQGKKLSRQPSADPEQYRSSGIHVQQSVTISKPAADCYVFWRDLELLPQFMHHLKSVTVTDQKRSHWVARAPLGFSVEWDAEIVNDVKDREISWRSVGSPGVDNSGSVHFLDVPGRENMTEIRVVLDYIPPAGKLGSIIASLFGEEPNQTVKADLQRFQQLMETGEVASNGEGKPRAK